MYKIVVNKDIKIQKEKEQINISPNNFVSFGKFSILMFFLLDFISIISFGMINFKLKYKVHLEF